MRSELTLPGGRRLTFREFGDPSGRPVLYFHGWPGSASEAMGLDSIADKTGLRIVSLDRPGFGGSEYQARRTVLSWACDVEFAVDALSVQRFNLMACSGGAPYAFACAHQMATRVGVVALACPLGPVWHPTIQAELSAAYRWSLALARHPALVRSILAPVGPVARGNPGSALLRAAFFAIGLAKPASDREALARPEVRRVKLQAGREAFEAGAEGPALDLKLVTSEWGFDPFTVRASIKIWHGGRDTTIPAQLSRLVNKALENSSIVVDEPAGHTSIFPDCASEMLEWVSKFPNPPLQLSVPVVTPAAEA